MHAAALARIASVTYRPSNGSEGLILPNKAFSGARGFVDSGNHVLNSSYSLFTTTQGSMLGIIRHLGTGKLYPLPSITAGKNAHPVLNAGLHPTFSGGSRKGLSSRDRRRCFRLVMLPVAAELRPFLAASFYRYCSPMDRCWRECVRVSGIIVKPGQTRRDRRDVCPSWDPALDAVNHRLRMRT